MRFVLFLLPLSLSAQIAHWGMDGNGDDSTGAHPATISGSYEASGDGQALQCGSGTVPTFNISGSALTIVSRVRMDAVESSQDPRIISKATGAAENDHYFMLGMIGDGRIRARIKAGGVTKTLISGQLQIGEWVQVAVTYDGQQMRLYKNWVEVGMTAHSGVLTNSTAPIAICRNPDGYGQLTGQIDELWVFDRALSPEELQQLDGRQPPPSPQVRRLFLTAQ